MYLAIGQLNRDWSIIKWVAPKISAIAIALQHCETSQEENPTPRRAAEIFTAQRRRRRLSSSARAPLSEALVQQTPPPPPPPLAASRRRRGGQPETSAFLQDVEEEAADGRTGGCGRTPRRRRRSVRREKTGWRAKERTVLPPRRRATKNPSLRCKDSFPVENEALCTRRGCRLDCGFQSKFQQKIFV